MSNGSYNYMGVKNKMKTYFTAKTTYGKKGATWGKGKEKITKI